VPTPETGGSSQSVQPSTGPYAARCRDLVKIYRTKASVVFALDGVDMDVPSGNVVAVFGPSGSGKSSLARILAASDLPDEGTVEVGGLDTTQLGARARRNLRRVGIGYVFADPAHNLLPYLDASDHIELALKMRGVWRQAQEVSGILGSLGLGHRLHHVPAQLSGGEQQRLAVACAISGAPSLVVLDEPTAELDRASAEVLLGHISDLRDSGTTFVISSHDPAVASMADVVVELHKGSRVR
jgi:putative ABC transport system ATP-binding protein